MVKSRVPIACAVTRLTCCRELRRFVIGFSRAVVVSQVTAYTRCGQTVVLPTRVTLVARCLDVLTG